MNFMLFVISLGLGLFSQIAPGVPELLWAAGLCLALSLFGIVRGWVGLWRGRPKQKAPDYVVVDGSNVLHWKDGTPDLETLREVLAHLIGRGLTPGVVFDANAGYKIAERHHNDHAFSRMLGLPEDRVMVVAKGTPADPVILAAARDMGARIVTNDRYRDWVETHPEVQSPGHLIRGGYREGKLWLDLPEKP